MEMEIEMIEIGSGYFCCCCFLLGKVCGISSMVTILQPDLDNPG